MKVAVSAATASDTRQRRLQLGRQSSASEATVSGAIPDVKVHLETSHAAPWKTVSIEIKIFLIGCPALQRSWSSVNWGSVNTTVLRRTALRRASVNVPLVSVCCNAIKSTISTGFSRSFQGKTQKITSYTITNIYLGPYIGQLQWTLMWRRFTSTKLKSLNISGSNAWTYWRSVFTPKFPSFPVNDHISFPSS